MNVWFTKTKIFALFFLIFVNFNAARAQTDSVYRLQAGTQFKVEMDNEISSAVARVNDTFTATLVIPSNAKLSFCRSAQLLKGG